MALAGADTSWPSEAELAKVSEVRKLCQKELSALTDPTRDVVGDLRITRFLRFNSGDVTKAAKGFGEFLTFRVREDIDAIRKGVIDLKPEQFLQWLETNRSPFAPAICPFLGETPEGHMLIYGAVGFFKAVDFVKQRPACHTMDTDLLFAWCCVEWVMKQIEDRSYAAHKMLYTIKVIDMRNLGKEKLPILVPEIRHFAQTNVKPIMNMYCEHDILIMILNAPFVFRMVWAFASSLLSKRQQARVKVFSDALAAEPQAMLKSLAPLEVWPEVIGGARTVVPNTFPLQHDDPALIAAWMKLTKPCLERSKSPAVASAGKAGGRAAEGSPYSAAPTTPGNDSSEEPKDIYAAPVPSGLQGEEAPVELDDLATSPPAATGGGFMCCAAAK
mmetsp:Transcript_497/g.1254  ORF Transcript_497/g.1254 Transcript_497/m.1254 type:complete len:387 (-) Transcript_497:23-1183(-)